ncbi:hypothetical protein PHYSODRAFT_351619 [Phytophthora sojae]|uniref:Kinesin motor domain-containing protein n=1 Tax=Phytophthora sojae (strain P6497) TaxID=1094619 RepID=G4ZPH0_PHYSP|nr:hypothetical protein PHYSODRAFT_351619 [Phytophthora sojae]EGZ15794.1 hypothetical protein PHYSODRAFT_351619 [Phytophthora sojae]|eukprot:XP_009529543.1 hypothetical protein PHYSODRAFT_351619 [Phytophthora sojae]
MADRGSSSFGDVQSSGASSALPDVSVPVLSQIHVSCYVTAANRAAPVFEVLPQHNCVRVVNKASSDAASGNSGTVATGTTDIVAPVAEWDFHSVFSSTSPSHAIDFFTEITLPALRTARDGINSNVVVWGVHPTQKFRLLFGKSVGGGGFAPRPEMAVNDVVELYGQLVGMLHAFYSRLDLGSRPIQDEPWRLGISSWIIVNNQEIDLLKSPIGGASTEGSRMPSEKAEPLSFVSLEATSLATAFRIVQTAKTNRIVRKQNAESVHFFVRLALFHGGQVSTVHLVDLIDQKESQDPVLNQEKYEFYNILQGLRQPSFSPRRTGDGCGGGAAVMSSAGKMVLSNFMLPLLTANAKTFLYANVIDSRSSLRESVQMLNAVANLRGFACVCKPLRGVTFEQLRFQASPDEERQEIFSQAEQFNAPDLGIDSRPTLNRASTSPPMAASSARSSSPIIVQTLESELPPHQLPQTKLSSSFSDGAFESEAMSWLSEFAQRKRNILGGSIDTIDTVASIARVPEIRASLPLSCGESENEFIDRSDATLEAHATITDLYKQLRESLEDVQEIELAGSESPRGSYCSLHSLPPGRSTPESHPPLPIVDQEAEQEDLPRVGYSRSTIGGIARHQLQQSHEPNQEELLPWSQFNPEAFKKAGLHPCILEPPNLNGLDAKTAEKVQAADATLLRKNYDALLSIVREQQQAKEAAEARAAEALQDQEEQRAMFEVQIENMKLANVGLRSKVRALGNRTSLPQVFEQYEQELRTLHAQVEELQARNVALELRVGGDGNGGPGGSASEIKKKYQQVVEEKLALERELMEHRRRERLVFLLGGGINRHHQVHSRLAGESTRRVDQLSRDLNNKEEDLVATRLSKQRLSAEMNQALEKADQLHHENEKLLQEKAATAEELLATRMYLASLENEKKKASILDRFVEKHGNRMNKLRQHCQTSSGNWRRDQYARECEDKLLATVKRSLPQAVPLCNKLLRRLEMQELSLREFSEREVDFINLLVELVSDQPTVSLKQMIEQEMTKLQSC